MDLKPGDKLGPYEILSRIGEGGMGTVWKARDARLGRDVALKVSKAEFTARFAREARTVAALNHPNVCQLYDVGPNYLVMELIDGVPLKGPLPVEKAVEYASQILDALDAAHRKGITHRDLKPANILVTKQGIKLLDFGLAKKAVELGDDDKTLGAVSVAGQISGTLQYMAPEQMQGKEADARSDIFSFGCVLYEMLSGTKAFKGSSAASIIAAILEREPEPLATTPPLDRVIRTCLAKDPDKRFQTALDLKRNLHWAMEPVGPAASSRGRLPWIVAAALGLLAVVLAAFYLRAPVTTALETRVDIVTPPASSPGSFALSPDGRKIAYVATSQGVSSLWVRPLDSISAQPLPGTEGAVSPFWSPDSRSLGFFADSKLKRIGLGGGEPQTLTEDVNSLAANGTWSAEGTILFNSSLNGPLERIPAAGGQTVVVTRLAQGEFRHFGSRFLPGGRQFLFASQGVAPALWLGSLDGIPPRRIAAFAPGTDSAAQYLAPGWLVRVKGNILAAQRFDNSSGQLSGDPVTLAQAVGIDAFFGNGFFSVSPSGTLAWRSGTGNRSQLLWFNRTGQNVGAFGALADFNVQSPELSPDGKRAAVSRGAFGVRDIWLQESTRAGRFTFHPADDVIPIWSPDGVRVVFASNRKGVLDLYQKPADGSGSEQLLLQSAEAKWPNAWSPDGRFILYNSSQNNGDLMLLPLSGARKPYPFLSTPFNENQGIFSADGKWVAYQSNESGRFEIYVRPFPGPGGQWQVSTGGGTSPRWRSDGKELYYLAPDNKLLAVAAAVQGTTFVPGTPQVLFQTHPPPVAPKQQYDVSRDGRFLINTELQDTATEPIHLLLNWHPPK